MGWYCFVSTRAGIGAGETVEEFVIRQEKIKAVAEDLGQVSNQLTEADLAALVDHVDKLAINSEEGIQKALEQMGHCAHILSEPNNILAVEYCKAILTQVSSLIPMPIMTMQTECRYFLKNDT